MGVVFRRRARAQGSRHRRPRVNRSVDVQGQEGSGEAGSREYHVVLRQEIISIEILLSLFGDKANNSDALVDATYPISIHS